MTQKLVTESPEKTRQHVESRETSPDSVRIFQAGLHPVTQLQRTLGNRHVAKLIQARRLTPAGKIIGLQRKLTVGAADDQYEQEADRVAHQVINTSDAVVTASAERASSYEGTRNQTLQAKLLAVAITPVAQRQKEKENKEDKDREEEDETEPIQTKSAGALSESFDAGGDVETQLSLSKGRGSPLPDPVRAYMEPRFGVDFSHVHVHTGSEALQMNQAVGAQAFTHGSDIYFGAGQSPANLELTAHELTHVVQQTGGAVALPRGASAVQKKESGSESISPRIRTCRPTSKTEAVLQRDFLDTLGDAADTVSDVASSAADTVSDVAGDAVDAVSDAASDAVDAVSGLIDSAVGELQEAFDSIVGQIDRVWDTVKNGITDAVEGAIEKASGFLGGIGALFGVIGTALNSLDADSLRAAWAAITGAANAALAGVQGIVAQVTATVDGLWSGLKGLADGLIGGLRNQAEGLINRLPGPAQGPARSLWNTIERKLTSTWQTIESSWNSLRESALKSIGQVIARVEGVVAGIKDSVISTIIATFDQVKGFFTFIKQVIANPDSLIEPIVQEIIGRLQGLPDKAKNDAQTKAQEQAASGPGTAGAGPDVAKAAPAMAATAAPRAITIQRVMQRNAAPASAPRTTLGVLDVISGCWDFITDKLAKIWGNLGATIKEMVIGVLDPRAIWKGLNEDWEHMSKDLSTRVSRFEGIRTDSWASFSEDLSRWLSNLIDFPLIIWRTINAMLGRLSVYIGLAIILGGAVAGAIAGGTGGAVFGSVFPGAGTAGGGLAGIAAGAWAGAQAGYAVAETVGLVLLVSFVAAEQLSVQKALIDLLSVPQSEEEQSEDFNQATDSVIAIATAALLILIAFIGVALAKRVWSFVKSIPGRFKPKPKVVEPEPVGPKPGETKPVEPRAPAKRTTADGHHEIEVSERGIIRCSPSCGDVEAAYPKELEQRPDLQERLNKAKEKEAIDPESIADEVKDIDAELAKVRRANLAKAKAAARGTIEKIKKLLSDKENAAKLSGEEKQQFGDRQRQLDKDWDAASESAEGAKGDPDLEGIALEEFENIDKKAKELEAEIDQKLKGPGVLRLPDSWDTIQPDVVHTTADGRSVSFSDSQIDLGKQFDPQGKHLGAIEKGKVAPKGNNGLVPSQEPGFDLKSKVLGIGGDHRFHGRFEEDVLHFPGKMTDH